MQRLLGTIPFALPLALTLALPLALPLALGAGCAAAPAPAPAPAVAPAPPPAPDTSERDRLAAENDQLRRRIADLEKNVDGAEVDRERQAIEAERVKAAAEAKAKREEMLAKQRAERAARRANRPGRPDPAKTYSIPLNKGVSVGSKRALVTMVVATEAACPFCWRAEDRVEELRKLYKKDLRVVYQSRIIHPTKATESALAFCAADKQGKGMKMWRAIRGLYDKRTFSREAILEAAKANRIRTKRLVKDMDGDCKTIVADQDKFFKSMGVNGTPSFFINGRYLAGAQPLERFKKVIDEQLATAREMVAAGVDRKSIYPAIVALGQKKL